MNKKTIMLVGAACLIAQSSASATVQTGKDFALIVKDTGRVLSMENGSKPCTANRTSVGTWEKFRVEIYNGYYYIRSTKNGKYLRRSGSQDMVTCTSSLNKTDQRMQWGMVEGTLFARDGKGYREMLIWNNRNNKYLKELGTGSNDYVKANASVTTTDTSNLSDNPANMRWELHWK